ncbi:hypothetical protein SAMN05421858_2818 [Haladaptatus litoreus]|uniref:Uncharacterized protein n=1 Tax=Haladaptatus litoreus TaxID=553468 RepID=A0A1N7BXG5_9EURY|nr:hypothetical protein [Haladaptatus litoreus]SIR56015.1 hypothetical protein SAMN05421858_2818 [Haladaptatus litoreus]
MKRDVLSGLMITIGILLSGTVPGLVLGAPMATAGGFLLIEPRLGKQTDILQRIASKTR